MSPTRFTTAILCLAFCLPAFGNEPSEAIKEIGELSKAGKLFGKDNYKTVRATCTKVFLEKHKDKISAAYGEDFDPLTAWLDKNVSIKEEFYTAIDEKHDNIPAALTLFRDLWKKYPDQVLKYYNLAIAYAVVWDDQRGLYDYRGHQVRTHSSLPESFNNVAAVDAFKFLIDNQKELLGGEQLNRLEKLPWEFLIYVVDHKTPYEERKWAMKKYVPKRQMVGKIYSDVEYDMGMLQTQSKVCKLADKPYTLENILKFGGVCAMQADFAARVSKSVAVPAAYVGGESQFSERHAWVMWVEVRSVVGGKVNFTLESHGRYLGDNYYTGELHDPQTAQKILDRDMERRLSAVATDRIGKRQAELAMKYFDEVAEAREFSQARKIRYLDACLRLCHFNESAWFELARQVASGELEPELKTIVLEHCESMLKTFAKYPDFTYKLANDLLKIQPNKTARNKFYERLVTLYETAGRPDLACEARFKWAEFVTEEEKWTIAAKGIAMTVQKFPAEGRYIPKLMDKLTDVCGKYKAGNDFLAQQYLLLLKNIPSKRGAYPSKFCIEMHEKAIKIFKTLPKKEKTVSELEQKLAAIKLGKS
jgi:hypothetical protein